MTCSFEVPRPDAAGDGEADHERPPRGPRHRRRGRQELSVLSTKNVLTVGSS
jgi:hypothetical protein